MTQSHPLTDLYILIMKKLLFFFIISLTITSGCRNHKKKLTQKEEKKETIISGKVFYNPESPELLLILRDVITESDENFLLRPDSNNYFTFRISIDFPQYFIIKGDRNVFDFFVFPGDSVFLKISASQLTVENESHAGLSAYMDSIKKIFHNTKIIEDCPTMYQLSQKPVTEFEIAMLRYRKSLFHKLDSFNKKNEINDLFFREIANRETDMYIAREQLDYFLFRKYMHHLETELPVGYFDRIDSLKSKIDALMVTSGFNDFYNRLSALSSNDPDTFKIQILKEKRSLSRDIVLSHHIGYYINNKDTTHAGKLLRFYNNEIDNLMIRQELIKRYLKAKEILENPVIKNAILSDFSRLPEAGSVLSSITGKYKGKVIYLKFWAPWCAPCVAQIPYAEKLEEIFSPDNFVLINLCVDTPKDRWKATISEKQLRGYQYLLNDQQYKQLQVLFRIEGIPHYVLIDRKGNIVNEDAPIPGDQVFSGVPVASGKMEGMNAELIESIKKLMEE
jgi:thiol-disulfide isomerase/thioredoxin